MSTVYAPCQKSVEKGGFKCIFLKVKKNNTCSQVGLWCYLSPTPKYPVQTHKNKQKIIKLLSRALRILK